MCLQLYANLDLIRSTDYRIRDVCLISYEECSARMNVVVGGTAHVEVSDPQQLKPNAKSVHFLYIFVLGA